MMELSTVQQQLLDKFIKKMDGRNELILLDKLNPIVTDLQRARKIRVFYRDGDKVIYVNKGNKNGKINQERNLREESERGDEEAESAFNPKDIFAPFGKKPF